MSSNFRLFILQQHTMDFRNGVIGARARRHVAVEDSQGSEHAKNLKRVWVPQKTHVNATRRIAVRFLYSLFSTR